MLVFRELNRGRCKTYLIGCARTRKALIIDPVREHVSRYLAFLAYHQLTLDAVVDTHTHADHPTGSFHLRDLVDARLIMHRRAPAPGVTHHVEDGDAIEIGEARVGVLYTPGHTPDSISLHTDGRVFTGDVLLIGGTGRADFAGGDPGAQYDSITKKLFALPDQTLVFPAHDYRGNTSSTIGEERRTNSRIAGRTRAQYIELMASLNFPLPDKIQEVLQPNQTAIDDDRGCAVVEAEALEVPHPLVRGERASAEILTFVKRDLGHGGGRQRKRRQAERRFQFALHGFLLV